jgi:hypothetical protein
MAARYLLTRHESDAHVRGVRERRELLHVDHLAAVAGHGTLDQLIAGARFKIKGEPEARLNPVRSSWTHELAGRRWPKERKSPSSPGFSMHRSERVVTNARSRRA